MLKIYIHKTTGKKHPYIMVVVSYSKQLCACFLLSSLYFSKMPKLHNYKS